MPQLPQWDQQVSARAGVPDNPVIKAPLGFGLVAGVADQASQILAKKEDEDGRIWAAQQISGLRTSYAQRLADASANGEDLTGYTPKTRAAVQSDVQRILKDAPSDSAARYFQLATPDFEADATNTALGAETSYRVTKRVTDTKSLFDQARNQIADDPSLFPKLYAENRHLLDSLDLPISQKKMLENELQGFGLSALQRMGRDDPAGTLKQIDRGVWDNYLDPDRRDALVGQLEARMRVRDAGASQDAIDLAQSSVKSIIETGQHLSPDLEAQIKTGLTPREFERYQSQVARADEVYRATGDMATLPPGDMVSRIEKLRPQGGDPDFADKEAAYSTALQRYTQVMNARRQDPGLAVRQAFPDVAQAWQQYEGAQGPDQSKALQNALSMSQKAQTALGIPITQQRLMPDEMARSIAGQIRGAAPEKAAQTLNGVAQQFGSYWPKAFRQMSRLLDPASKVAATIDDSATAALLIETSRQPQAELEKTLGLTGTAKTAMLTQIQNDENWKDLAYSLGQRQGGSQTANDIFQAVQTLALGRMRAFQEDQTTATDKAIKAIIGDKYDFAYSSNGQAFRVPKGHDFARIQGAARDVLDTLAPDGIDVPGLLHGQTRADGLDKYMSAVHRNGYFVTNDDETGVILYNERGVPVTRNNVPLEFRFDQLEATPPRENLLPMGAGGMGGPELGGPPLMHDTRTPEQRKADEDAANEQARQAREALDSAATPSALSSEMFAPRGPGDAPQLVSQTRDNTQAALNVMNSIQGTYDQIHGILRDTAQRRIDNQRVGEFDTKTLREKLGAAKSQEDRDVLIGELTDRARSAKTAAARQAILKELDKHWAEASFKQKALIMSVHAMDAGSRGADAIAGMFR